MEFRAGASVVTAEGEGVGNLERVVMDPKTKEVTHIVVEKGLLFTTNKLVPIGWIASADGEQIRLRPEVKDFKDLQDYEEQHYVAAGAPGRTDPDREPAGTGMPDVAVIAEPTPIMYLYPPAGVGFGDRAPTFARDYRPGQAYYEVTEKGTPEDTVALDEGARVLAIDGKHVGDVERVITDSNTDQATHFVISQGLLFKTRKLVPVRWVMDVREQEVRLAVGSELLDSLRPYED